MPRNSDTKIRQNLKIADIEAKLSQFNDDTTLIWKDTSQFLARKYVGIEEVR